LKQKTIYTCQQCGLQSPKWLGRCPDCQAWGGLVEESVTIAKGGKAVASATGSAPQRLAEVSVVGEQRLCSGFGEFAAIPASANRPCCSRPRSAGGRSARSSTSPPRNRPGR